jgi:hypothetical protein
MESGPCIRARKSTSPGKALDIVVFSVEPDGQSVRHSTVHFAEETKGPQEQIQDQLTMSKEAAQALMDDLWDAGVRPTRKPEPSALHEAKNLHIEHLFDLAKMAMSLK